MMPTAYVQKNRVRTGYERTLAHLVNKDYAGTAAQNGKVTNIDEEGKVIEVTYADGSRDLFEYGEKYSEISGMCITHDIVPAVKLGQKISKSDIITYNKGFFNYDKYSKQVDFSIGNLANVCMIETDTTNEDSTEISTRLAQKLTIFPTNMRVIRLPRQAIVYSSKQVGDYVLNTDDLLVYEESEMEGIAKLQVDDAEVVQTLSDLNRRTPEAKFNGEIVQIEAYYGCDIADMTPSLASIVRSAVKITNRRNKLAKGTQAEFEYPEATKMPEGSKFKGVYFDEDTVCLIYYIKEKFPQDRGDKLVVCNQLKCTVAGVFAKPVMTESGTEVDLLFSANSVANRIVISPFLNGIISRIVEKIEDDAVAMYFADDKK